MGHHALNVRAFLKQQIKALLCFIGSYADAVHTGIEFEVDFDTF